MNTATATTGTYTLTGVTAGAGQCDCCHRTLRRLFKITGPDGTEGVYGRACARKLTGWTPELGQALHIQAVAAREAELRAEGHGELLDALDRLIPIESDPATGTPNTMAAGSAREALLGRYASIKGTWYYVNTEYAYELASKALAEQAARGNR